MVDKRILNIALLLAIFVIFMGIILLIPQIYKKYTVVDVRQERFDKSVGEIYGSISQGQTFYSNYPGLARIDVFISTFSRRIKAPIIFHLKASPQAKRDLRAVVVNPKEVEDDSYQSFSFSPINASQRKNFYFYVESPNSRADRPFTVWQSLSNAYPQGNRYQKGSVAAGDLRFKTYAQTTLVKIVKSWVSQIFSSKLFATTFFVYATTLLYLFWRIRES